MLFYIWGNKTISRSLTLSLVVFLPYGLCICVSCAVLDVHNRELKMSLRRRRLRRQRERQKSNRFRLAKQQLCTRITLFVYFFAVTVRLRRELPNFTFYRQREHTTTNFSRLSLNLNIFLENSNPGKFGYIGQSERVVIVALQFQRT